MKIALDFDDTLCPFVKYAIEIWNKNNPSKEPMSVNEVTSWGINNTRTDELLPIYKLSEVFENQIFPEESKDFVNMLQDLGHEVFIVTAVDVDKMGIRAKQIIENLNICEDHIIMGKSKDLLHFDVMIDDAPHHILNSNSEFPILMRQPWNQNLSGLLSINTLNDALEIIKQIERSRIERQNSNKNIICIVGPTGSGKHDLLNLYLEKGYTEIKSYSTNNHFKNYIPEEVFTKRKNEDFFIETTVYGGYKYGMAKKDFSNNSKKKVVVVVDICGAITLKSLYNAKIVFIDDKKENLIKNILDRKNMSNEEKTLRILSLDLEKRNKKLADQII